jgi:hypothetical protein
MRYVTIFLTSIIILVGCESNSKKPNVGNLPNSGLVDAIDANYPVPDWAAQSLGGALSFVEQSEDRRHRRIQFQTHLPPIDYKSKLIIIPNKNRIKKLAGSDREVLPHLPLAVSERLGSTSELIKAAKDYIDNASRMLKAVEAARSTGLELSQSEVARLQKQIIEQGKQGLELVNLILEVAEARAKARYGNDEEAIADAVGRMTAPIFKDESGNPVIFNPKEFGLFLSEEVDFASARALEDAEIANDQGTVQFRMWAWIRNQASRVSVENYYDTGTFEGPKRPRVAFCMTADEQERVERGYNTAKDAARLIRDVRNTRTDLRRELETLWDTLRSELKNMGDLPTEVVSQSATKLLDDAIKMAMDSNIASAEQIEDLKELKKFITEDWKIDMNSIRGEFSKIENATSSEDFMNMYLASIGNLRSALTLAINYPQKIATNVARIEVLSEVLKQTVTSNNKAVIDAFLEKVLPETKGKLKELKDGLLTKYANLAGEALKLVVGKQQIELADGLDVSGDLPPIPAVNLDDIKLGTIDLNDTPADKGDELIVRAELFTTDENGEEDVLMWTKKTFEVNRFGITDSFSSHLVFVNRLGSGQTQDPDTDFDPAPSASWTLRYRIRPDVNAEFLEKLYCNLDPGIGINTAAMDFEDENFQIGVGVHLNFFDDLLILGYGYNLQAETDHDYTYLGIGVLEALDTVGNLFGAESGLKSRF